MMHFTGDNLWQALNLILVRRELPDETLAAELGRQWDALCEAGREHVEKTDLAVVQTITITLKVNGQSVTKDVEPQTLLVEFIRETLRLTGTHVGCDTSQCGACTVHVDGRAVKSCGMLAAQAAGRAVTTIEGLAAADGTLHPMQAAFRACHGLQCGFCTPGMVMSAVDLCKNHPHASEGEIRELLEGNICRCTGYQNIVKAVQQGAAAMKA